MNRIALHQWWYDCGETPMFESFPVYCHNCRWVEIELRMFKENHTDHTDSEAIAKEEKRLRAQYPCQKRVQHSPIKY